MSPVIVVVDDYRPMRELLSAALADEGYQVVTTENGDSALKLVRANREPLVVLLDISRPALQGMQVLEQIAQDAQPYRHIYLGMTVTPDTLPPDCHALLDRLCVPLLSEPFDLRVLLDHVKSAYDWLVTHRAETLHDALRPSALRRKDN